MKSKAPVLLIFSFLVVCSCSENENPPDSPDPWACIKLYEYERLGENRDVMRPDGDCNLKLVVIGLKTNEDMISFHYSNVYPDDPCSENGPNTDASLRRFRLLGDPTYFKQCVINNQTQTVYTVEISLGSQ